MRVFPVPAQPSLRPIATWAFALAIGLSTASAASAAPPAATKSAPRPAKKKARLTEARPEPSEAPAAEPATEAATKAKDLREKEPTTPPADTASAKARTAAPEEEPRDRAEKPQPDAVEGKIEIKPNPEALAYGAPTSEDEANPLLGGKLQVHPYFLVTGGIKGDFVKERPREIKNNRISTFALGRIGMKARWLDFLSAESEFMAAGGIGLHGTSAFEGQAALQVRQQVVRLTKWDFRLEVGRFIDEASADFFSAHIAETFIQDTATREPLLFTGFNLGNGVGLTYKIIDGLRVGFTFNASNPVSTTASLMIGGGYPPFDRFYTQPYQQVNQSANNFPDDTFHEMVLTPSILVDTKIVDAHVAFQRFDVNTNTNSDQDAHILGYNLRGTARLKLFDRMIVPFVSGATTRNDTLLPANLLIRSPDRYVAVNVGGGFDVNVQRRFKCSHDCADGVGVQYQQVQYQIGDRLVTTQRYFNVGATYWLAPNVSFGARFAFWNQEAEQPVSAAEQAAGKTRPDVHTGGERSIIAALRFIMP
jgi:hypothetical protein